jgi:hypothetical protein
VSLSKDIKKRMSWKTIRKITGFSNEEIEQVIDDIRKGNNNKEM